MSELSEIISMESPIYAMLTDVSRTDYTVLSNHVISYVWTPKVFSRLECVSKSMQQRMQVDSLYQEAIAGMYPHLTMTAAKGKAKLLYSAMAACYAHGGCSFAPYVPSFLRKEDSFQWIPHLNKNLVK